jgi:peptidoglycan/LPS O-acetylase OafA/YrhL
MNEDRDRLAALDGLRGFLAAAVVLHHCMSTVSGPPSFSANPLLWIATYSPTHLLWAGTQAVFAFFVLSGFVLIWPHTATRQTNWSAWYVQRFARLYLPIWAGAVFSYLMYVLIARPVIPGMDSWLLLHAGSYSTSDFAGDLLLVADVNPILNTAYWSLRWEVIYSLLVPLVVFALHRVRSRILAAALALALVAAVVLGTRGANQSPQWQTFWDTLKYLPMFLLGALAAQWADEIRRLIHWIQRERKAIAALWLLAIGALLWPVEWGTVHTLPSFHNAFATCGALLLVVLFAFSSSGKQIGQMRVPSWLGQRSFSIYLVHGPIVVSIAYLLYPHYLPWMMLLTALPLSIGAGAIFFVLVEKPLHTVSRNLGRLARSRLSATEQPIEEPT